MKKCMLRDRSNCAIALRCIGQMSNIMLFSEMIQKLVRAYVESMDDVMHVSSEDVL